jgi:hypothetical protein
MGFRVVASVWCLGFGAAAIFGMRAAETAALGEASFGVLVVAAEARTGCSDAGSLLTRASAMPTPKPTTQRTSPMSSGLRRRAIR